MRKHSKINHFELAAIHFKNELKAIFTDKGALLILVGAMFIYPLVYSIGYFNETLNELPFAVVDLDKTATSRKYTNMLDASPELQVNCKPGSLKEAEQLFMANKITGVLLIPKNFQYDLQAGKQANVALYADGSYFLKYKTQFQAATYVNAYFNAAVGIQHYLAEGKTFQQARVSASPLQAQSHILYNPASAYGSFVMPGLILIIIQQTLLIGIGILGGSFSESKVSPFVLAATNRRKEILSMILGKTGAFLSISVLNICFAVFLVHHWFNYPDKANVADVFMLLFPFLLAVIFLGITLSTLFKHRESAIVFMMFLSPIALFLSGLSWPVSAMPEWIQQLAKILPGTTAVPAYLRLRTMGVELVAIKSELYFLYTQATIYGALCLLVYYVRLAIRRKSTKTVGMSQ
jgi:ABC-2 type transport system permease protein